MSTYVYIPSEGTSNLFRVGFYTPKGNFIADDNFPTKESASARVSYLNGGSNGAEEKRLSEIIGNINVALKTKHAEVSELRQKCIELNDRAVSARQELRNAEENRDHFCYYINRIAKLVGMTVENAAPDTVERHVKGMVAEVARLAQWKREMTEVDSQCDWQELARLLEIRPELSVKKELLGKAKEIIDGRTMAYAQLLEIDTMLSGIKVPLEESHGFLCGGRALTTPERVALLIKENSALKLDGSLGETEEDKGMKALVEIHNQSQQASPDMDYCQQCGMVTQHNKDGKCIYCDTPVSESLPEAAPAPEPEQVTVTISESPEDLVACDVCGKTGARGLFFDGKTCRTCLLF